MTSICNYSHPELQISEGLERHGAGVLFPYNPEFYELASGLYGPGSILAWHFLVASVVFHWFYGPRDDQGHTRPGMSTDLLAVVAYSVFAATDLLVQAINMAGTEHRALAIFCLRHPTSTLEGFGEFGHTPLRLAEIPPDVVGLGQHVVELTGPLAVSYVFVDVCFLLAISVFSSGGANMVPWRPTAAARTYILVGYAYVALALVIFHLGLGSLGISIILFIYEAAQPFLLAFTLGTGIVFGGSTLVLSIVCIAGLIRRDRGMVLEYAQHVGWCVLASLLPGTTAVLVVTTRASLIPDLGVTIVERDQLAALLAGLVALVYTVYTVLRDRSPAEAATGPGTGMEEMQALAVGEEDGVGLEARGSVQWQVQERRPRTTYDDRIASHGTRSITF
ncbi:uncharacterized protein B0H64DRAFT_247400 [Chaetomium fimeti]|uniref:Uncharacterized protein n=1 Tax=Chaetomium fimeti TaxID=1854472 RepID=A0AAE0H811_9PEZI|nr:hypothetical protein B0H64DRAFT_247400 [Chaetomium fimeti]